MAKDLAYVRFKKDLISILTEVAKNEDTIPYSDLGKKLNVPHAHDMLGKHLGPISAEFDKKYGFLISAIVVKKYQQRPGDGFYIDAKSRGRDVYHPKFWEKEVAKIYAWANGKKTKIKEAA